MLFFEPVSLSGMRFYVVFVDFSDGQEIKVLEFFRLQRVADDGRLQQLILTSARCRLESFTREGHIRTQAEHTTDFGGDDSLLKLATVPLDVDDEGTTCLKALYFAFGPGVRQGWQQVDSAIVTLE